MDIPTGSMGRVLAGYKGCSGWPYLSMQTSLHYNFNTLVATDGLGGSTGWIRTAYGCSPDPAVPWSTRSYLRTWSPIGLKEGIGDYWTADITAGFHGTPFVCPGGCAGSGYVPSIAVIACDECAYGVPDGCVSAVRGPTRYDSRTDTDRFGAISRGLIWNIRSSSDEGHIYLNDIPLDADTSVYNAYWHPSPTYSWADTVNPPIASATVSQWTHLYSGSSLPVSPEYIHFTTTDRWFFKGGIWGNLQTLENASSFKYISVVVGGTVAGPSPNTLFTQYTGSISPTLGCVALPSQNQLLFAGRMNVSGSRGYTDGSDNAYREVFSMCTHLPCILTQSINDFTGRPDFLPIGLMSTYFRGYFGRIDSLWATGDQIASGTYQQTDTGATISITGSLAYLDSSTVTHTIGDETTPQGQYIEYSHDLTRYRRTCSPFKSRPQSRRKK